MPTGAESPFASVTSIHLCRLLVVDDIPFEGFPAERDQLKSSYLFFSANIAGDLTSSLMDLVSIAPDVIYSVWSNCVAFPGVESPKEFIAYLKECQIDTSFFFGGYPQASLLEVISALQTQKLFTRFLIATQGARPQELKEKFRAFMDDLRKQPLPRPGTV